MSQKDAILDTWARNGQLEAINAELLAVCREIADHLYEKQDYARCREMARAAVAKAAGENK